MSGIEDVAREAGVSKATASRALTGHGYVAAATRARVLRVAETLGYVASSSASSLATGRTRNIGVVMPYLNRWFFAEVLEGIQEVLLAQGFDLTLYDAKPGTDGRRRVFDDFLARKRFDGLIAVALEPDDHELERLVAIGRPVVSVVGDSQDTSVVRLDDMHAARRATAHLIDLGHERIAFLGGISDQDGAHVDRERLGGYHASMRDAGLTIEHAAADVSLPGGYDAAVDLLSDPERRPTAIVAACDEVAIGAIIAARRLGIAVPAALSVVGIDNHEYAEMFGLTTLEQSPREQGAAAAELLLEQLRGAEAERTEMRLQPRLIVRSSTSTPPGTASVAVGAVP
ncbi:LacI family DNA-binding transcriptional regulator [Microbacterium xanthum]|uniref:LacI family DNA-binding transcriptional regulator n=1 Tax=Microbacterium xanthum TaxID=3079794 RepID=UPI002AD3A16B|nr:MULTISPECIES: LacI family DNA-binding transcriptional regulator [unclassified Microbacterium]MDZ8171826.1 LacI family DNA-binding transcriptional regulator [Microbacterium sp. KSW-48]MDZ8200071.1 LacI family DNA-binding transcriptional regulator [Microbacterium sp. SSW1-59]